jgi:hypothetical protein
MAITFGTKNSGYGGVSFMDWTLLVLKIGLTAVLFIILTVICALLITRIQHTLTVQNKREHIVRLSNQGNLTSIFTLSIVSVEQMFSFKFLLNGVPLITVPQVETLPPPSSNPGTTQSVPSVPEKTENTGGMTNPNLSGVTKGGQAIAAKSGQAASFLSTLASLLPGSLGSSLRAQSETLRQTQTKAQAAARAPKATQRKVESLKQQSSRLVKAAPAVAPAASAGSPPAADPLAAHPAPVPSQAAGPNVVAAKKVVPDIYTVQTQPVEPGRLF